MPANQAANRYASGGSACGMNLASGWNTRRRVPSAPTVMATRRTSGPSDRRGCSNIKMDWQTATLFLFSR